MESSYEDSGFDQPIIGTQLSVGSHSSNSVHESSMTTVKNLNLDN